MLPETVLSTVIHSAVFLHPRDVPKRSLIDYELGGRALQDPSEGLQVQTWKGEYVDGSIVLEAPSVPAFEALTVADVTEFQFTFDQNMQLFVAYVINNSDAFYRWHDPTIPGFVTEQLPVGSITPRCAMDDKRAIAGTLLGLSDIVLAYVNAGSLFIRLQRDRFDTDYELYNAATPRGIVQVGMNRKLRFQFLMAT